MTKSTKTRPIWVTITTEQGEVIERIDAAAFDLTKPLGTAALWGEIRDAIDTVRRRRAIAGEGN